MRRNRGSRRGSAALAMIGVGVFLCVVLLGGILGQLTKNNEQAEEVSQAEDSIADVESVDSGDETTSVDDTDITTGSPEENTDGFKISVSCVEEDRTWLDIENPKDVDFKYHLTIDGDVVELQDDDFKEDGKSTAFEYEQVIKRYYENEISQQGNHRARAYNIVLSAESASFSEKYTVWKVRDFAFHDYDIKDDELKVISSEYHEASTGNAPSLYVEFSSLRPGRNCYLLRYEADGKTYETWATSDYGSDTYYAFLDHYTAPEDIDNPVVQVVKGDGETVEVKIDGYGEGASDDESDDESDDSEDSDDENDDDDNDNDEDKTNA